MRKKMTGSLTKLQSEIDDHKEELSDALYKSLSSISLDIFKEHNFYLLTYLETNVRNFNGEITSGFTTKEKIVRLSENQVEILETKNCGCNFQKKMVLDNLLQKQVSYITNISVCPEDDCYEENVEEITIVSSFYLLNFEKI